MPIYLAREYGTSQTQWDAAIFMKRELMDMEIDHELYPNVNLKLLEKFRRSEAAKFKFERLPKIPSEVILIDEEEYVPNTYLLIEWKTKLDKVFDFIGKYGYQNIRPERKITIDIAKRGKRETL
jgi:hypothetical protein